MTPHTISSLLKNYTLRFEQAGVDSPRLCAELILGEVLSRNRAQLVAFSETCVSTAQYAACETLALRRAQGEPMAYILGRKEFYGLDFMVNKNVLVPRPDTELIVDLALNLLPDSKPLIFADLGTGSGAILTALLYNSQNWRGLGLDISAAALGVANYNIQKHNVQARALLVQADFAMLPVQKQKFDFIVSNPPYIPLHEYEKLNFEVLNFEPRLALESGPRGLDHPSMVIQSSLHALRPGGYLIMEIGSNQKDLCNDLFSPHRWSNIKTYKDFAERDRTIIAVKSML